jgi:hypothetical protein
MKRLKMHFQSGHLACLLCVYYVRTVVVCTSSSCLCNYSSRYVCVGIFVVYRYERKDLRVDRSQHVILRVLLWNREDLERTPVPNKNKGLALISNFARHQHRFILMLTSIQTDQIQITQDTTKPCLALHSRTTRMTLCWTLRPSS